MGINHSEAMARDRREWRKTVMEAKSHNLTVALERENSNSSDHKFCRVY